MQIEGQKIRHAKISWEYFKKTVLGSISGFRFQIQSQFDPKKLNHQDTKLDDFASPQLPQERKCLCKEKSEEKKGILLD